MTDQVQANPPQENPIDKAEITLKLPVVNINQILFALAQLPYAQVAGTIAAIRQQGDPQVELARQALAATSSANGNHRTRRKKTH